MRRICTRIAAGCSPHSCNAHYHWGTELQNLSDKRTGRAAREQQQQKSRREQQESKWALGPWVDRFDCKTQCVSPFLKIRLVPLGDKPRAAPPPILNLISSKRTSRAAKALPVIRLGKQLTSINRYLHHMDPYLSLQRTLQPLVQIVFDATSLLGACPSKLGFQCTSQPHVASLSSIYVAWPHITCIDIKGAKSFHEIVM